MQDAWHSIKERFIYVSLSGRVVYLIRLAQQTDNPFRRAVTPLSYFYNPE